MSKLVDERVVQMEFDNKNFEKNVKQSQQSIASLKQSLDFGKVGQSIDAVTAKFSAMDAVMFSVINRLTDKVMNFGKTLVKSLSVDNRSAGWNKLEEDTKNVFTLSNLDEKLTGGAENIKKVLDKLIWYSDNTSYSYNDMVNAIAQAVNSGMNIDDATEMILGFANECASAGKDAATFNQALYQLVQSFGRGSISFQDWQQAINTKGLGTAELKQNIVDTLVSMGKLDKQTSITGEVLYGFMGKTYKLSEIFAPGGPLTEGLLTTEAFAKVMSEDYAKATNQVYDMQRALQNTDPLASFDDAIEALGDKVDKASLKFLLMAQRARTWTDVVNATKDAVSTGWMLTFKEIIGDADEAIDMWSKMAESFYDIFNAGAAGRINTLKAWRGYTSEVLKMQSEHDEKVKKLEETKQKLIDEGLDENSDKWRLVIGMQEIALSGEQEQINAIREENDHRKDLFSTEENNLGAVWNLLNTVNNVLNNIRQAVGQVFGITSEGLGSATKRLQVVAQKMANFTEDMPKFRSILSGILSIIKIIGKATIAVIKGLKPLTDALFNSSRGVIGGVARLSDGFTSLANNGKFFATITKVVSKAASVLAFVINKVVDAITWLVIKIREMDLLPKIFSAVTKAFKTFFGWMKTGVITVANFVKQHQIIPKIFDAIKKAAIAVWGALKIVGNWIKKTTLKVVEFIKQHDILSKAVNVMKKAFTALGKAIQFVWNILKKAVTAVADGFKKLTGMGVSQAVKKGTDKIKTSLGSLVSSVDNARQKAIEPILEDAEKSEKKLTPLQHFFKGLVEIFKGLWSIIKAVWTIIGPLLEAIGKGLQMIGENLQKAFAGDNAFSNFLNLMKVALGAGTLVIAVKVFKFFKDAMTAISDVMYAVQKRINAAAFASYAKAMKDLAIGILLIAAAIILLGTMDTTAMWKGVAAVMTILAGFAVILIVVAKIMSSQVTPAIQQATSSAAVATKTGQKFFATLKQGISGVLAGAKNLLSSFGKAAQIQALGLMVLELAAAVFIMVIGIKMIAKLDWASIGKGMAVISILLITMSGLAIAISRVDGRSFRKAAKGIYALALTLVVIAKAAKMFAQMSFGDLGKASIALAIMGGALAGIAVIISQMAKVASKGFSSKEQIKGFNSMMKSFMSFAATMVVLGIVVKIISTIPMGKAFASLGLMTGLLIMLSSVIVGLALVVKYLATTSDRIKRMYGLIGMFAALAGVLTVMAIAIAVIARIPWKAALMATGVIVALLGMMIILAAVSKKSSKAAETTAKPSRLLKMAAGLVVLASSLLVFAAGLAAMAFAIGMFLKIGLMNFLEALKMIGILLAGVAVSALVLKPVIPVIITFGAALAIIGAAFLAMGLGMDLMVEAIPRLLELLPSLAAIMGGTFAAALLAVKENMDLIGEVMGLLFDTMLQLLGSRLLQIADMIVTLMLKIIKLVEDNLDPIFKFLKIFINKCLQLLIDTTPKLVEWIGTLVETVLADFAKRAPSVFDSLYKIFMSLLDMLLNKIPEITSKLFDLLSAALRSLGDNISKLNEALYYALDKFITSAIDFIVKSAVRFGEAAFDLVIGLINGLSDAIVRKAEELRAAMEKLVNSLIQAFLTLLGFDGKDFAKFKDYGGKIISSLINGFQKFFNKVGDWFAKLFKTIGRKFSEWGKEVVQWGKNLIDGFLKGIKTAWDKVTGFFEKAWNTIKNGFKSFFGIHSPSRLFMQYGEYLDEGLAIGLEKETSTIDKAMTKVAGAVTDGIEKTNLNDAISEAFDSVTDNIDAEPTIRPVMDLSEIQNGATRLSSLMNGLSDYQVDGSVNLANRTRNEVSRNRTANMTAVNPASATPAGDTTTVSNVFNITGSNAKDIADEVSQRIQQSITRNRIKYGNV